MQTMITDTLCSVLSSKERARLESYDAEKMSIMYKAVLEDKGLGSIQQKITQLNERAKCEIDDEEKKKKRRAAISEAGGKSLEARSSIEKNKERESLDEDNDSVKVFSG